MRSFLVRENDNGQGGEGKGKSREVEHRDSGFENDYGRHWGCKMD